MARRQEFVGAVQRWEERAAKEEGTPEVHAVYLDAGDPAKVLIITQFGSRQDAEVFESSGLMDAFHGELLKCTAAAPIRGTYELFYSTGPGNRRVVFGQDA